MNQGLVGGIFLKFTFSVSAAYYWVMGEHKSDYLFQIYTFIFIHLYLGYRDCGMQIGVIHNVDGK